VSSKVGISPKVIQKYCIRPVVFVPSMKGMMNISPKKIKLMKNQLIERRMASLLCEASS
jgi:hypothetical protein